MKRLLRTALLLTVSAPTLLFASSQWLEKVPPREHDRGNTMASDPEAIAAGELLFEENCAKCHGPDARGKGRRPSLRTERVQDTATPGDLHWFLVNGNLRRGMPSWSKLPDQQIWQIVTYLKSLRGEQ
jgi:mono/diheme cytochrome c family protein